jgi:hypothetical protein
MCPSYIKKVLALSLFLVIHTCIIPAQGKYGGGNGTEEDPYQIWDANHMQAIGADANDWNKHFVLMADIDLSQFDGEDGREKFNMIGSYWIDEMGFGNGQGFSGVFDGNDCIVSSLSIDWGWAAVGLFAHLDGGTIMNLGLAEPDITGRYCVGALIGQLTSGTVSHCYVMGGSVSGLWGGVGGLIGSSGQCFFDACSGCHEIRDCYVNETAVVGSSEVGGLIGQNWGTVIGSYSHSSVIGQGDGYGMASVAGGLVGGNGGMLEVSYSSGSVSGESTVGGLVGGNYRIWRFGYSGGIINNCYAIAHVDGNDLVGGLVGLNAEGTVTNCYAAGSVTADANFGGLVGKNGNYDWYDNCDVGSIVTSCWDIEASNMSNMCGSQEDCSSGCDPNCGKTSAESL